MKRLSCIAVFLALLALFCWHEWPDTLVVGAPSGASGRGDLAATTDAKADAQTAQESPTDATRVSQPVADAVEKPGSSKHTSALPQAKPSPVNSTPQKMTPELAYLATLPPVEAVVLEEEENGQVTFRASPADLEAAGFPLLLQETMQKPDGAAASDLAALFQSEESLDNKLEILTASSLLEPDQNTQKILELALGSEEPSELRISAIAYAADQGSFMLQSYLDDPDPDVRLEAQSAYERLSLPPLSNIVGSQAPPTPLNLARPPEWINQARAN